MQTIQEEIKEMENWTKEQIDEHRKRVIKRLEKLYSQSISTYQRETSERALQDAITCSDEEIKRYAA
jgi:hypothetical protein